MGKKHHFFSPRFAPDTDIPWALPWRVRETDLSQTADWYLGVPLTNCVALRNLLSLSEPPFPDTFGVERARVLVRIKVRLTDDPAWYWHILGAQGMLTTGPSLACLLTVQAPEWAGPTHPMPPLSLVLLGDHGFASSTSSPSCLCHHPANRWGCAGAGESDGGGRRGQPS